MTATTKNQAINVVISSFKYLASFHADTVGKDIKMDVSTRNGDKRVEFYPAKKHDVFLCANMVTSMLVGIPAILWYITVEKDEKDFHYPVIRVF